MLTPTSTQKPEEFGAPATMTNQDMSSSGLIAANMEPTPTMQPTMAPTMQPTAMPTGTVQNQPGALTNSFGGITNGTAAAPARDNAPVATVQSQLQSMLASDSPYLTAARTRAMQQANSRGLINSSIAAGAGEFAAIDAAAPIAQADAQFANQSAMLNRELDSQEFRQTQNIQSQERLQQLDFNLRESLMDKQIASDKDIAEFRAGIEKELVAFRAQIQDQQSLLDITRGRNANLQQYTLQMGNNFLDSTQAIWQNPNIPYDDKQRLIDNIRVELTNLVDLATILQSEPVLAAGEGGV